MLHCQRILKNKENIKKKYKKKTKREMFIFVCDHLFSFKPHQRQLPVSCLLVQNLHTNSTSVPFVLQRGQGNNEFFMAIIPNLSEGYLNLVAHFC